MQDAVCSQEEPLFYTAFTDSCHCCFPECFICLCRSALLRFLHGKLIGYPEIIQRSRAESGHFAVPFRGSTTSSIVDGKKAEAMSMILSEGEIGTFQECVRRDLLTYVSYPSFKGATRCFAYPQFLVDDETLTLLEDSAFPDNGCLPMVTSRTTPHELLDMFGNVVVMRVNDEHPGRNRNYPESEITLQQHH